MVLINQNKEVPAKKNFPKGVERSSFGKTKQAIETKIKK